MTDPRGVHSAHLDAETIAALVDRALDPAARAAAEAHLADCADCREVWVETSELANGESADAEVINTDTAPAPSRSRRWIYAGAGLAAAAAIAFAVFSPPLFNRGDRPELRELVEAVGTNRRTEARLTGGFAWGPVPSVTRGADAEELPTEVEIAVANLGLDAREEQDAAGLASYATANVIAGRTDEGVRLLEQAVRLDGGNPELLSDLAAAYFEQFRVGGSELDLVNARNVAEQALSMNSGLREARFNFALALQRLGQTAAALEAWRDYLTVERDPAWRKEAEARLDELDRGPQ